MESDLIMDTTTHILLEVVVYNMVTTETAMVAQQAFTDFVEPYPPKVVFYTIGGLFIVAGTSAHTCDRPVQMPARIEGK